jgi:SpoVK/Ycf46/Vps4 family AAA+-type ATPase
MRENDAYADSKREMIERICALAEEYSDSVLTIFDITKRCVEVKKCVYSTTRDISFVEISEDVMFGKEAREYVVDLAKNEGIDIVKEVNEFIDDDEKSYRAEELNRFVNKCKREILRTEIYPQYANIKTCTQTMANEAPKGSAYEELMEMIGLSGAKEVINNAIKYYKAQALFEKRGIRKSNSAMHMIFTGNPGTAKTSVARLIAQIMKDNGVLSVGSLYELGRADLVGKYVGWTAQIVKKRFEKARGSVLFIDEAYSLVDGTHSFGDEAINTIVQEMENNRSDMIVIFAGYPNEMERFMKKNPGLRSRIAYHINFDDYNAEELYSIAELMAKKDNIHLDSDVKEKLMPIFEAERNSSDFGNGRFVRNLLEQARMKQAARIMESNPENMSDAEIATLMAKDFEFETMGKVSDAKRIGFV